MDFQEIFPIWNRLSPDHQTRLLEAVTVRTFKKGAILRGRDTECTGLLLIRSGQLRAFILSEEGREITIYRLFDLDICLFSASCILRSIQFDVTIEAEKDTELWLIPADVYKSIQESSAALANYTNELMASRFSDVMWLIEQIMWKSMDKRIAAFLLEEAAIEETPVLSLTHERIANHLGSHREVITRILKYLQNEELVRLSRGKIELLDKAGLEALLIHNPSRKD